MDDIIWQDPPPARNRAGQTLAFIKALKERPGCWALYPHTRARNAAHQGNKTYPGTEWTTRLRPDGQFDVYARWVGEPAN